jgi:hypothetical protein
MGYIIKTLEWHKAEIERNKEDNMRRLDYDVSDCALSSWASSQMISFHHKAIEALTLGLENGSTEPMWYVTKLFLNGEPVKAKVVESRFGQCWCLETPVGGRKFVPMGENSRVQKSLGLKEDKVLAKVRREMKVGGDMVLWFKLIEA